MPVRSGVVECVSPYNGGDVVPSGDVVTAVYTSRAGCGPNTRYGFNAVQVMPVGSGVVECVSPYNGSTVVPSGYAITARYSNWPACGPNNGRGFNAVQLTAL